MQEREQNRPSVFAPGVNSFWHHSHVARRFTVCATPKHFLEQYRAGLRRRVWKGVPHTSQTISTSTPTPARFSPSGFRIEACAHS
jgi:hypothetical protein